MRRQVYVPAALLLMVAVLPAMAASQSAQERAEAFVKRAVAAALKGSSMPPDAYLKIHINEEETPAEGNRVVKRHYTALLKFPELLPARLELESGAVLVNLGSDAWAKIKGKLDTRRQTPMMLRGKQHQVFFPLLLPWSLNDTGVNPISVKKTTFEKQAVWALTVRMEKPYFVTPVMTTDWVVFFDPKTLRPIAAQYTPPPEYLHLMKESVRYRILRWTDVMGVPLPAVMLAEGFHHQDNVLTGHLKTVKLTYEVTPRPDPLLFANPKVLQQLDEE